MVLEVKNLSKKYTGGIDAIVNLSFEINKKSFLAVLGQSGCGKTTLLKIIAGLLDPNEGKIFIDGKDVTEFDTKSRDLSMVFQEFNLYPHMTVYENVLQGLYRSSLGDEEKDQKVKIAVAKFGLLNYLNFKPRHLSEGLKQKVAICKSFIRGPKLLLLDEPFANLDVRSRQKIQNELLDTYKANETTFIYATHNIVEAEQLSTEVVILDKGQLLQMGTFSDIKSRPISIQVAQIIYGGNINVLRMYLDGSSLSVGGLFIPFISSAAHGFYDVVIPYESIVVAKNGTFSGQIADVKYLGQNLLLSVDIAGQSLKSLSDISFSLTKKCDVTLTIDATRIFCFRNNVICGLNE